MESCRDAPRAAGWMLGEGNSIGRFEEKLRVVLAKPPIPNFPPKPFRKGIAIEAAIGEEIRPWRMGKSYTQSAFRAVARWG